MTIIAGATCGLGIDSYAKSAIIWFNILELWFLFSTQFLTGMVIYPVAMIVNIPPMWLFRLCSIFS